MDSLRKMTIGLGIAIIAVQVAMYMYYVSQDNPNYQLIQLVGGALLGASFIFPDPPSLSRWRSPRSYLTVLALICFLISMYNTF